MRTSDWPAVALIAGIAVLTGYGAGRSRPKVEPIPLERPTRELPPPDQPVAAVEALPVAPVPPDIGHHRLRPDVLLGPVLLVMIGIIVDRLRESTAGETVTAWFLIIGATAAAMLARWAGYRWIPQGFYCFLVGFSWGAAALYAGTGMGGLPQAWLTSTLTASVLWLALDLSESIRAAPPGHRLRPVLLALGHWVGFVIAWAVLAPLLYLFVFRTLAGGPLSSVGDWLIMIAVCTLGLASIFAITVPGPWHLYRRNRRRADQPSIAE